MVFIEFVARRAPSDVCVDYCGVVYTKGFIIVQR